MRTPSRPRPGGEDFRRTVSVSRRRLLQAGGLAALGLTLPDLLRAGAASDRRGPRARACILVYLFGGPAHIDTLDMKPDAPEEVRGEFRPARTRVPGLSFCELLPRLGRAADQLTVVRSMTHERTVHGAACGFVLTGERTADPGVPGVRGPDASVGDHPALASGVCRFRPADAPVPSAVTLPYRMIDGQGRAVPGQTAGMLGDQWDPWLVEQDPNGPAFHVEGLGLPADLSARRLADRQSLLSLLDGQRRDLDQIAETARMDDYQRRAFGLLASDRTQEAFRIDREPDRAREAFGRNTFGQSCLLACRLVEAGVRFVQVNMGARLATELGWDTHSDNFRRLRDPLLPVFDAGFPALLDRLRDRGLLDATLVVCMSEFGRTPQVEKGSQGRDHWPKCYSLLLAGAGLPGGGVWGASDRIAAYPVSDPVTPEDMAATVYHALGVDPDTEIRDRQSRPVKLAQGTPLLKLWGE